MINKIFLWVIVVASLVWIGYVGMDILSDSNNYSPTELFGSEDEKLLIINRPSEVNIDQLSDFANAPSADLVRSLNPTAYQTAFVSANQAHILLVSDKNWTAKLIDSLFAFSDAKAQIGSGEFNYNDYSGRFYKKHLYMSRGEITNSEQVEDFKFDAKSSASIIHFDKKTAISSVSDIYFKEGDRIDYITYNDQIEQGKQVKDEVIFAGVVTKNFSKYHFFERDYYATLDSVFAAGPMSQWILNGFLELEYDGSTVLISDYIGGQDPILTLNDLSQTHDTSTFSIQLTQDFPSNGKSYTIKYLEDLVVMSESQAICDKVIADFKLGNTIALNKGVRYKVYGALPQSVSERIVTKDLSYSKAVYRGKLLETQMGQHQLVANNSTQKESTAMNCGFDVLDFQVIQQGSAVVLGKKGEVARFKNGKLAWSSRLEGLPTGGIQVIDLHQNGEKFVLVNTVDKIHLWNMSGHYVSGFPIALETEATTEVKFYRWKGKSYFLVANDNNEVVHYDSKGRELNVIKSSIPITRNIDVWASQQKLFAGFANDRSFIMYNMDKRKVHREFQLVAACKSAKIPNELLQFGFEGERLVKIDQKGLKHNFSTYNRAKLIDVQGDKQNPTLVIQTANEIHLLNSNGIPFSEISLPFNEIANVYVQTSNSGKTTIAIIDGLENNVYLYGLDGERLTQKPLEGQTKVMVSSDGSNRIITTVVDQFIVQYFE